MNSRSMYPAGLGVCLALLRTVRGRPDDHGQFVARRRGPQQDRHRQYDHERRYGAATTAPASGADKHHSTAHHQMHAKPEPMAAASAAGSQESAYRAALRNCVAGPAGQKERCLDDAIARHGRSG